MESTIAEEFYPTEGASLSIVFYNDACPTVVQGTIVKTSPIAVRTAQALAKQIRVGQRVMLVRQSDGHFWEADTLIAAVDDRADQRFLLTEETHWKRTDSRKHPRYPATVPVKLVAIQDMGEAATHVEYSGNSHDLSLGGASVDVRANFEIGWLVEFQAELPTGNTAKALAIVARRDEATGRLGLEFVDFIGNSRYLLHGFLAKAA